MLYSNKDELKEYHKLCDLAKVPYGTSIYDILKTLSHHFYPNGYICPPNRAEKRKKRKQYE